MKKLITLAALVAAASVQAASIDWNTNFGTRNIKNSAGSKLSGSAYLILASDVSNIEGLLKDGDISGFNTAMSTYKLNSDDIAISNGKTSPTSGTATNSRLTAGTEYEFAFVIYDSANQEYYVTGTATEKAYDANSSDDALKVPKSIAFDYAALGATTGSSGTNPNTFKSATEAAGSGDVPEPATGALALAGVALLFKRRRA